MNGDGHHSDPHLAGSLPPSEMVELLRGLLREEIERAVEAAVVRAMRPPLVGIPYLMWMTGKSESTIIRYLKKHAIPGRNLSGDIWKRDDGPKVYSLAEWEARAPIHTSAIKNDLRRRSA